MFATPQQLEKKIGKHGTPRREYLRDLVKEFKETMSIEYKEQILANLANFAYDPVNFNFLRELNVDKLFLDHLSIATVVNTDNLREFAAKGILNLCADEEFKKRMISRGGVELCKSALSSPKEEITLAALAVLNEFLQEGVDDASKLCILNPQTVGTVLSLKQSPHSMLSKMSQLFIEDHCSQSLIKAAVDARKVSHSS